MAFFALIAGYFFYVAVVYFVRRGVESSMMGQVHADGRERIRDAAAALEHQRDRIVPDSDDHHAAVRRGKAHRDDRAAADLAGTDLEIILGKWLGAMALYAAMLGLSLLSMAMLFLTASRTGGRWWSDIWDCCCSAEVLLAIGTFISTCTKNQIVAGVAGFSVCLMLWVLDWAFVVPGFGRRQDDSLICRCCSTSIRSPRA